MTLRGDGLRLHAGASSRRLKAVIDDQKESQGTTVTQVVRKARWKKATTITRNSPETALKPQIVFGLIKLLGNVTPLLSPDFTQFFFIWPRV